MDWKTELAEAVSEAFDCFFEMFSPTLKEEKQKMTRKEVLDTAAACVCGQREQDYGSPERNFEAIGHMWSVYLRSALGVNMAMNAIRPHDVAAMMALFKVARIASARGTPTDDCWIDLAGYAACGGEITSKEDEPQ